MASEESLTRIKNPLTMVALFAAISEVAMAVVTAKLPEKLQEIFIWFVMGFPVLLVGLFFFVLYRKPAVFFSPGDYKREELYVASIGKPSQVVEQRLAIVEETLSSLQDFLAKAKLNSSEQAEYARVRRNLQLRQSLETNQLYAFITKELRLDHDAVQRLVAQASDALNFAHLAAQELRDPRKSARLTGLVTSFPSVVTDFSSLKATLTQELA